jgi:hypothetical protein
MRFNGAAANRGGGSGFLQDCGVQLPAASRMMGHCWDQPGTEQSELGGSSVQRTPADMNLRDRNVKSYKQCK